MTHALAAATVTLAIGLAAATSLDAVGTPPGGGAGGIATQPAACLDNTYANFWASPQSLLVTQTSATLNWDVWTPANCPTLVARIGAKTVALHGSMPVQVTGTTSFELRAWINLSSKLLGTTTVTVTLPFDSNGRPNVVISANDQQPLLIQALATPNAIVRVQNQVEMDLSRLPAVEIAAGVTLIGARTPREPGGRFYTSAPHHTLFLVTGDNVRISGVRIDGGEMAVADSEASPMLGIVVDSNSNVEIDNNEIYGWRGAAVSVQDELNVIDRVHNAMTVRIHDNYIHHNRHAEAHGYGVVVSDGAYVLIERNVFDWNRHAIAGDGSPGSGYLAYRNLVLEHGGDHYEIFGVTVAYTHQFDMHGTRNCSSSSSAWDCGPAGEYIDIRYNAFFNANGPAIKLRGTPAIGEDVAFNVFAQTFFSSNSYPPFVQNETGLHDWDNQFGIGAPGNYGRCDFDGDGIDDLFLATGRTWWFNSAGSHQWVYLNSSTRMVSDVLLGDVDGDRKCDVTADGVVSRGGTGPWKPLDTNILWQKTDGSLVEAVTRGTITADILLARLDAGWQLRGTGDFNGDLHDDLVWEHDGQIVIWYMDGGIRIAEVSRPLPATWQIQAVGDFDGNGRDDVLWRQVATCVPATRGCSLPGGLPPGQLMIWFNGDNPIGNADIYPAVYPAVFPSPANYPAPPAAVDTRWTVKGAGDFDGDGRADILWQDTTGAVAVWSMAGGLKVRDSYPGGAGPGTSWQIQGLGDFDGNGRSDILWRHTGGALAIWFDGGAAGVAYPSFRNVPGPVDAGLQVQAVADFNGDGRADILWRRILGPPTIWLLSGGRFIGEVAPRPMDSSWQIRQVLRDSR